MPHYNEPKEKKYLQETESDDTGQLLKRLSKGGLSSGSENNPLFAFFNEARRKEANAFRLKGYNSQTPKVDTKLLTQLHDSLSTAKSRLYRLVNVMDPLDSRWLLEQLSQIERLTAHLSPDLMQSWVKQVLPIKHNQGEESAALGSRHKAQSLVRRLESTLLTLTSVVKTLGAINDYSTPEKSHKMLVAELTDSFSSVDGNTMNQALRRIRAEALGNANWASLMQIRAAAYEADKPLSFDTLITNTQSEAKKANKKSRQLRGDAQFFFSRIAGYLQSLASECDRKLFKVNQRASAPIVTPINDDAAVIPLTRSNTLLQRVKADVTKKREQGKIVLGVAKGMAYRGARVVKHGHLTHTPSKERVDMTANSIIRSILRQWQQPASKIQYITAKLLAKVKDLKKIERILASYCEADATESKQESRNITVKGSEEDDLDAKVRKWVSDNIEQAKPKHQLAAKVAILQRLLADEITRARNLVPSQAITEESAYDMLMQQRADVVEMVVKRSPKAACSIQAVDKLLPDIARDLFESIAALDKALQFVAPPAQDFAEFEKQAGLVQLLATKYKERLSAESARLTARPLDESSRGSRLARHWAKLVNEYQVAHYPRSEGKQVSKIGPKSLLGNINNAKIEISKGKGTQLRLLASRLQNASGRRRLQNWLRGKSVIEKKLTPCATNGSPTPITETNEPSCSRPFIEPVIETHTHRGLTRHETTLINELTTRLKTKLGPQYDYFLSKPHHNCANAAIAVVEELRKSSYAEVKIVELGIWPNGHPETVPINHFVVTAKKDAIEMAVDLTLGQFELYGFTQSLITTKYDWIYQWQQAMKEKQRLLVKLAPVNHGVSTSPFSLDYNDAHSIVPGGEILHQPCWYK